METAALLIVSQVLHVRCGAVLNVLWNADNDDAPSIPRTRRSAACAPRSRRCASSSGGWRAGMTREKTRKTRGRLGRDPVGPLLIRLALPTICAQVVNLLYNIVDRIYIGQIPGEGALALTGMGVTFSGHHADLGVCRADRHGRLAARLNRMGAGEHEKAERTLGTCTAALWALSIVLTVLFLLFQEPLLVLFGASADTPALCAAILKRLCAGHDLCHDRTRP